LASVFALGVALFPTASQGPTTTGEQWVRLVHLVCAGSFFVCLAWFSLFIFTTTDGQPTPQKLIRNRIYRACGIAILVALALAALNGVLEHWVDRYALQDFQHAVLARDHRGLGVRVVVAGEGRVPVR
jgi:heme A synthase